MGDEEFAGDLGEGDKLRPIPLFVIAIPPSSSLDLFRRPMDVGVSGSSAAGAVFMGPRNKSVGDGGKGAGEM